MNTLLNSARKFAVFACAVLVALYLPRHVLAAPGALDTTFGGTGKVTTGIGNGDDAALNMTLQPDGKVLLVGYSHNGSNIDFALVRYNVDGSLDTTFNSTGAKPGTVITALGTGDDGLGGVALQPDGKILVVGSTVNSGSNDIALARYKADGSGLDPTFGSGTGRVILSISAGNDYGDNVAVQNDGKIVILGHSFNGGISLVVARYLTDGTPDSTFDGDGKVTTNFGSQDIGHAMILQPNDQKILVTGLTGPGNNSYLMEVVRYTTIGGLDTSFNGTGRVTTFLRSGNNYGNAVAVQADGKIVVAGLAGTEPSYDIALVRYTDVGALDTTFNPTGPNPGTVTTPILAGDDQANSVKIQSDGKIVVAGNTFNGSNNDFMVVRYNPDGSLDTTFNGTGKVSTPVGNGDDTGVGMALQGDGKIVVGGYSHNGSNYDFAVVRYLVKLPEAVTAAATAVMADGATLNGSVNPNASVTTAAFEYGLTTSYGASVAVSPGTGSSAVPASTTISGLLANQTYHYRLTATNAVGTTNGSDLTFTTVGVPPTATTGTASNVSTNSATISGTVNPNGSLVTSAVVEYGLTTSYGSSMNVTPAPGSGSSPVPVSAMLSGLQPAQTYHFRVTATNQFTTSMGADNTFATGAAAPAVTTGGFSNVTATSATVSGTVNPNGVTTTATFEFGLTTNYGSIANAVPSPGNGALPVSVSAVLGSLTPNRTYHYRLTATNIGGFTPGNDGTFNTPASLPAVVTEAATDLITTGATFHGTVNPNGSNTKVRFFYGLAGTSLNFATDFATVGNGTSDIPVSAVVSGLLPFTNYEYRMDAEAEGVGTKNGNVVPFKTLVTPLSLQPDKAFATLGGAAFDIDALANDVGDDLQIDGLISVLGSGRVVIINSALLNFVPLDASQFETADNEVFSYQVHDVAQNQDTAQVTVYYFIKLRGTYYGNFSEPSGDRVLRMRLDMDYTGLASGRLEWEDEQYPFKIQFDSTGHAQIAKARSGSTNVSLVADLQLDTNAKTIKGVFRDTGTSSTTLNPVLQFLPPNSDAPARGTEIAFIDPGDPGTGAGASLASATEDARPEGIGFTQVKIGKKGLARFITKMPDFGAFSVGKSLQPKGVELPRYLLGNVFYKRAGQGQLGVISGDTFPARVSVNNNTVDRIFGALAWQRFRPGGGSESLIALMEGFHYLPGSGGRPLGLTNASPNTKVVLSGGKMPKKYEFDFFINRHAGRAATDVTDTEVLGLNMNLKFNLQAGIFSGSFLFPGTNEKVKIIGGIGIAAPFDNAVAVAEPLMRGSFFVKSTGRTGRITIKKK